VDTGADDGIGRRLLTRVLAGVPAGESPLTHVADLPARVATHTDWPSWADPLVVEALRGTGVPRPWTHQVDAATLAHTGHHVVVATGTGSGKSLAYQLPVLTALRADQKATALYLSPTKAPTEVCSARTLRCCCAGYAGSPRSTAPTRCSCSRRPPWPTRVPWPAG
jgi:DEAD/DEAH box helicase domain-containing protein